MIEILIFIAIFGIPAASLIWLIVSAVRYDRTPKDDLIMRKKHRLSLILSSITFGILATAVIALMLILAMAVGHM